MEFGKEPEPTSGLLAELNSRLEPEIKIALDRVDDAAVRELMRAILNEILRVFDRLSLVESNLQKLDTLRENLSIMELLKFEIRFMIDFIEAEAMYTEGIGERLRDTFDGVAYGMNHDVKRVFERELTSDIWTKLRPVVYGRILQSHGLLTNCFQQTFITLIQAMNPNVDPIQLFNDFEARLRQSLLLCNDLSSLIKFVNHAHAEPTIETLQAVVDKTVDFRDGNMKYLMYRDWRGYEHHAMGVITAIESDVDVKSRLHQFGSYLEILYGHIKMRSVLKEIFQDSDEMSA
jgi:hypothetical protein